MHGSSSKDIYVLSSNRLLRLKALIIKIVILIVAKFTVVLLDDSSKMTRKDKGKEKNNVNGYIVKKIIMVFTQTKIIYLKT